MPATVLSVVRGRHLAVDDLPGGECESLRRGAAPPAEAGARCGQANPDPQEVMMRVGVRGPDFKAVERFGKEIAPLILTGPPNVTGFAGGRPRPSEVVAYWPALVAREVVEDHIVVTVEEV